MRPARIIVTVVFAAAIALTGCILHARATQPSRPQTALNPTHTGTAEDGLIPPAARRAITHATTAS